MSVQTKKCSFVDIDDKDMIEIVKVVNSLVNSLVNFLMDNENTNFVLTAFQLANSLFVVKMVEEHHLKQYQHYLNHNKMNCLIPGLMILNLLSCSNEASPFVLIAVNSMDLLKHYLVTSLDPDLING